MRLQVDGKTVFASTGSAAEQRAAEHLLFIHGAGMDHSVWVMPARHFARRGFNVRAPDLPGHGRSDGAPLSRIEDMSDWLLRFMDAAEIETAKVAGHSMGALVAHALASRHPGRVSALALVGVATPMPVSEQLLDAAKANDHAAVVMANTWSHSGRGRFGGNDLPGIWMMGAGERLLERAAPGVLYSDLLACHAFDGKAHRCRSDIPILVILGQADRMTPLAAGRSLISCLPNARFIELPAAGHSMLSECPNALLDALKSIFE